MGGSQSTRKRELGANEVKEVKDDKKGVVSAVVLPHVTSAKDVCNPKPPRVDEAKELTEDEKRDVIGSVLLPHLSSARDVCNISLVCKALHSAVASNDAVWQSLCNSYDPKPAPSVPSIFSPESYLNIYFVSRHPSSFCFTPSTKLPCHTWKQVYMQMIQYRAEMNEAKKKDMERYQKWNEAHSGYACGMRAPSPRPTMQNVDYTAYSDAQIGGFKGHPAKFQERILPFSVDLIRIASMYLDLLIQASTKKELFGNEEFLQQALNRYVNFMHLKHKFKNHTLVPTLEIEYIWVSHMLRPSVYIKDCNAWFGEVIDHNIMLNNAYLYLNKETALQETNDLYFKEFGEPYCSSDIIKKQRDLPHYNTTGTGPLDPSQIDKESTSIGYPFRPPKLNVSIKCAPAYVGDIGIVNGAKKTNKPIGLSIRDLIMDEIWLPKFVQYMKPSVANPLDTHSIFVCESSYSQPAHMRPMEVYTNLWKAYEKFLYMAAKYPPSKGTYVHPSYAIDVIWHAHMICPKLYAKETKEWVGYLVDHEPWPECDSKDMEKSSDKTDSLWQKEFGIPLHSEHTTRIRLNNVPKKEEDNPPMEDDDDWD